MNYGYIKVASAIPSVKVGDCKVNLQEIEQMIARAEGQGVEVRVFPELSSRYCLTWQSSLFSCYSTSPASLILSSLSEHLCR